MTEQDAYRYALNVAGDTIKKFAGHILDRDRSLTEADRAAVETKLGDITNLLWGESNTPPQPDDEGAA